MNKYVAPILVTLFCVIYLTYLITYLNVSKSYEEQMKICDGMKSTYIEEIDKRDDVINQMEQEINELRYNLDNCGGWCND